MDTPQSRPNPVEFIKAWQTSSTLAEVASKLRMTKPQCRVRACRYRQRGVPLKQFPPVELPVWDWDELAALAESLVTQDVATGAPENVPQSSELAVTS